MKHAVVVAHPSPISLTCSVAHAYAEAARGLGDTVVERDLYRIGFDPCLKAGEIAGPGEPVFAEDVKREREMLADVDVFAFVYPFWFNAPPAILKGYVDRVFSYGFGYGAGMEPLLGGRRMISFTTSGAPDSWVRQTGALSSLMNLFDGHLAGVCGLSVIDHVHNGSIVPGITEEAVADVLAGVRQTVEARFGKTRQVA